MEIINLDGHVFKKMITSATVNLKNNVEVVNNLNVFPVPDGDTGDNMRLTMEGGYKAVKDCSDFGLCDIAGKIAQGMFLGARGNSGVILSQFFDGLANGVKAFDVISCRDFIYALESGVAQAYSSVINPTEGTILTVMKDSTNYVKNIINDEMSFNELFREYLLEIKQSIERTPSLLPVLREAGVVDSGGVGFAYVVEGMLKALDGEEVNDFDISSTAKPTSLGSFDENSELEYGYCTEFLLQLQNSKCEPSAFDINVLIEFMKEIGDSIVCFKNGTIVKTHVHTKEPGKIISFAQKFGEFITFKLENMSVQHTETKVENNYKSTKPIEVKQHKKYGCIAVASGSGIAESFLEFGADAIVAGGQTMNPSVEDFIDVLDTVDAENIIIFPNNSNIILTAQQVAKTYKKANIFVVESKNLAQGYSALTMLDYSSDDIDVILSNINDVISNVLSGEVTYAIRNANINGIEVHKDDYIAIIGKEIISDSKSKIDCCLALVDKLDSDNANEVLTIMYGENVTDAELKQITNIISQTHTNLEVYPLASKHDIYDFIIILE